MKKLLVIVVIFFSVLFVGAGALSHISAFINNEKFVNNIRGLTFSTD